MQTNMVAIHPEPKQSEKDLRERRHAASLLATEIKRRLVRTMPDKDVRKVMDALRAKQEAEMIFSETLASLVK